MIIPYIIGFVVGFFLAAVLISIGWAIQQLERAEEHKREMAHIINLGERMMAHNNREAKYLEDFGAIRASLKTIALEFQRRGGWTH